MDLADAELMKLRASTGRDIYPASAEQLFAALATPLLKWPLGAKTASTSAFLLAVSLRAGAVILTKPLESSNIVAKAAWFRSCSQD